MKASLTIEAAFILSIIMLIVAWLMGQTITLYHESVETVNISKIVQLEPVKEFRRLQMLKLVENR